MYGTFKIGTKIGQNFWPIVTHHRVIRITKNVITCWNRKFTLHIKGQPVLRPPGEDVQMAAHREQEILRAFELPQERYKPLKKRLEAVVLEDWALATLSPHGFIGAQKFPLLRVVLGPQDDAFTEKGLFDFKSALYTVTQDSNRMAAKLSGAPIEAKAGVDILSDGIVEGSVQVSANGQPIVMLADHQSTGGYAKIATVIPCDIPALAQVRPGQLVGFRVVSVEEGAEACRKEKEKWTYLKEAIDHD